MDTRAASIAARGPWQDAKGKAQAQATGGRLRHYPHNSELDSAGYASVTLELAGSGDWSACCGGVAIPRRASCTGRSPRPQCFTWHFSLDSLADSEVGSAETSRAPAVAPSDGAGESVPPKALWTANATALQRAFRVLGGRWRTRIPINQTEEKTNPAESSRNAKGRASRRPTALPPNGYAAIPRRSSASSQPHLRRHHRPRQKFPRHHEDVSSARRPPQAEKRRPFRQRQPPQRKPRRPRRRQQARTLSSMRW